MPNSDRAINLSPKALDVINETNLIGIPAICCWETPQGQTTSIKPGDRRPFNPIKVRFEHDFYSRQNLMDSGFQLILFKPIGKEIWMQMFRNRARNVFN